MAKKIEGKEKDDNDRFGFATLQLESFDIEEVRRVVETAREHGWPTKATLTVHKKQVIDLS